MSLVCHRVRRDLRAFVLGLCLGLLAHASCLDGATAAPTDDDRMTFCLREEGDIENGRLLFSSDRLACATCHSLNGTRGTFGPDLSTVGDKFGRREIIRSLLDPSAQIAIGYEQTCLETASGHIVVGIVKQTSDTACELQRSDGHTVRVPIDEIVEQESSAVSAMPQGVSALLSLQELNDVVEFLVSCKQPESAHQWTRGMPRDIPLAQHCVTMHPMIPEAIQFDRPVWMLPLPSEPSMPPGAATEFWVVEHQERKIWHVDASGDLEHSRKSVFLDLGPEKPNEGRLACVAIHPQFDQNRKYYVYDRLRAGSDLDVVIHERWASADARTDSGREPRELLRVRQSTLNHFGVWFGFGPLNDLYI